MFDLPVTDPVLIFSLLLLIALAGPLLAGQIKLPGIIGLIVAGIIIGPHGFGVLERADEIQLLSIIGLLYLMFLAGLELDIEQFIRHRHHSIIFGAFTFTLPLIFGTFLGRYLLGFSWPASVLLSTMFSSHTLITYPMASRLGLAGQRAVTTTIGGTLITDTIALLVLAVIAALYGGDVSAFLWISMSAGMLIYAFAVILTLPRLVRFFFRNIATDGIIAYTGVMAAVFTCAYLAHIAGLEPIIGAFLGGLVLNRFIPVNSTLMNRIQFVGHSIFIPIFLISVGMLVNVRLFFVGGEAPVIAGTMVFAGIVTKWMAASASQRLLSYTHDEGMLIYGLSVNQAAATLAAVTVGHRVGIFTEHVVTGTIVMIMVTSLAGSWLTDRYARRVALKEGQRPYRRSDAPQRVLVALSNPHNAEELLELSQFIREQNSDEPLYSLTVVESGPNLEERIAEAEKLQANAIVKGASSDMYVVPTTRTAIDISSGILQTMTDQRISTAIIGWKGRVSSHSLAFGHKLDTIIERSRQMILVSRCPGSVNTLKRVVLVVPPLVEHQAGFKTTVHTLKALTRQIGCLLLTVSVPPTADKAEKIIAHTTPEVPWNEVKLKHWDDLLPWFEDNASSDDDLVILFSARKGRLAWRPSISKMPRLLVGQMPDINFLAAYPPEIQEADLAEVAGVTDSETSSLLPAENIHTGLECPGVSDAIKRILKPAFSGKEEMVTKLSEYLTDMCLKEPAVLVDGIVLLHAHIPEVDMPVGFLGISNSGWDIPHSSSRVHALFLLLSPKDASPEIHLEALANLVKPLRRADILKILLNAKTADEILESGWNHI